MESTVEKKSEVRLRKLKFIAEVKKNNYPNAEKFAEKLSRYEGEEGQPFACSARTVARDIRELITHYHAPLEYDPRKRGYRLRDPEWNFDHPVFPGDWIGFSMLGTHLASGFLPDPLRKNVEDTVAETLASSHEKNDFFDRAMIDSILCASGIKASIDPAVFQMAFDAWRNRQILEIRYRNPKGEVTTRKFEPHIIAFHKGVWYLKGYKYETREIRTYAIQRIQELKFGGDCFETDQKLLADTMKNGLFNYPKLEGIRLHCDASIAFYIYEQQKLWKSKIEVQEDGSLILSLNPTVEHDVIRWVLAEAGRIQVLAPESLRKKVAEGGKAVWEKNS